MSRPLRRRDALHQWRLHYGPNMTPMVDVVMVILIFFMASAAFIGPEWYLGSLLPGPPEAVGGGGLELPPARFTIRLERGADGRTAATGLGLERVGLAALAARLEELGRETGGEEVLIVIRPDDGVAYRDVVALHAACERAGLERVGLGG